MAVDPTALIGAAMSALDGYKQALESAAEVAEKAKKIMKVINLFEVTLLMIPSRGDQNALKKMTVKEDGEESEPEPVVKSSGNHQTGKEVVKDIMKSGANYVKTELGEEAWKKIKENILDSPVGGAAGIMGFMVNNAGGGGLAIKADRVKPGEIMKEMRLAKCTDLEITFVGMAFVINGALEIIEECIKTLAQVEMAQCLWVIMPWKVKKQNLLGEDLDEHLQKIGEYNAQLQNAVSIASYAVSLEQLENALNATTMLESYKMRDFWKRRIGIDKMRVQMALVTESFLAEVKLALQESKASRGHILETVKKQCDSEVCIARLLSNLWNDNADEWASVYEINGSTFQYGKLGDAIEGEFRKLIALETAFYSKISFTPLEHFRKVFAWEETELYFNDMRTVTCMDAEVWDTLLVNKKNLIQKAGKDGKTDTGDDVKIISLKPFERLLTSCTVPCFDLEIYEFDCLCLMKYERDPTYAVGKRSTVLTLEEVAHSRAYLNKEINAELHGGDFYNWNAPQSWAVRPGESEYHYPETRIAGIKNTMTSNFKDRDLKDTTVIEEEEEGAVIPGVEEVTLERVKIARQMHVLYAPLMTIPGYYSVRYCLDELSKDAADQVGSSAFKKKQAQSIKSYYYNRSVAENEERASAVALLATPQGVGAVAFAKFHAIQMQLLELQAAEAVRVKNMSEIKKLYSVMAKLSETYTELLTDAATAALIEQTKDTRNAVPDLLRQTSDVTAGSNKGFTANPLVPTNTANKALVTATVQTRDTVAAACTACIATIRKAATAMEQRALADVHTAFLNDVAELIKLKDMIRLEDRKKKTFYNNKAVTPSMENVLMTHVRPGTALIDDFDASLTMKDMEKLLLVLQKLEISYQLPTLIQSAWDTLPAKLVEWNTAWSFSTAKSAEDGAVAGKAGQKRASLSGETKKEYAALTYDKKAAHHMNLAILCLKEIGQLTGLYKKLLPQADFQQDIEGLSSHAIYRKPLLEKAAKETTRNAYSKEVAAHFNAAEYYHIKANLLSYDLMLAVQTSDIKGVRAAHEQREKLESLNRLYEYNKAKKELEGDKVEEVKPDKNAKGGKGGKGGKPPAQGPVKDSNDLPAIAQKHFEPSLVSVELTAMSKRLESTLHSILSGSAIKQSSSDCADMLLTYDSLSKVKAEVDYAVASITKSAAMVVAGTVAVAAVEEGGDKEDNEEVLQTLGYVIKVEDVPALAWGEHYAASAHASAVASNGHKTEDKLWRPLISQNFPYSPVTTFEMNTADFVHDKTTGVLEAQPNHGQVAIFVNFPAKKRKSADKDEAEKFVPTHVAVFADPFSSETFKEVEEKELITCVDSELTYFLIDLTTIMVPDDEGNLRTRFTVGFQDSDSSLFKDGPVLTFMMSPTAPLQKDAQLADGVQGSLATIAAVEEAAIEEEADAAAEDEPTENDEDQGGEETGSNAEGSQANGTDYGGSDGLGNDDDEDDDDEGEGYSDDDSEEYEDDDDDDDEEDDSPTLADMLKDTDAAQKVFDGVPESFPCYWNWHAPDESEERQDGLFVKTKNPNKGGNFNCGVCCQPGRGPAYHYGGFFDGTPEMCVHFKCLSALNYEEKYDEYLEKHKAEAQKAKEARAKEQAEARQNQTQKKRSSIVASS